MGWRAEVISLTVAGIVAHAAHAPACQPGPWTSAAAYAAPSAVVPKNIPAVYFFPGSSFGGNCEPTSVALVQASSGSIDLTASATEPNTYPLPGALESGASYELDYTGSCVPSGSGKIVFGVAESGPLPLETGKLEVTASGAGYVSWWDGACDWPISAAWVRLKLRPSCDLVPFLPVTRFLAEANGQIWWKSAVGSTTEGEAADSRTVDLVWASCGGTGPMSPEPGKVEITMRAHVVGAASDPKPAVVTLDLFCGDASDMPPPQPAGGLVDVEGQCISDFDASPPASDATILDGGPDDDAGVGGSVGASDADWRDANAARSAELQANGGCSLRPRRERSDFAMLIVVACGFAAGRRRRSKRSHSSLPSIRVTSSAHKNSRTHSSLFSHSSRASASSRAARLGRFSRQLS